MNRNLFALLISGLLLLGSNVNLSAQEDADDPMWETIMLTPDNTKLKVLGENMRAHNQKYHKEGAHTANVYTISTGPHTGKIVWIMGPLKFADLDTRPAQGGHDEDWRDNIMPNLKKISHGEYWKGDNKLSNTDMLTGDASAYPIQHVRYWEVNSEHGYSVDHLLEMISKTIKAMDGVNPWGVYDNLFRQGDIGRHLATVGFSKKWAEYDEDPKFKKAFVKTFGEDSWQPFLRGMDHAFDNSWDEVWIWNKEMSGN